MTENSPSPKELSRDAESGHERARRPWIVPVVTELPPLTELTLITGSPIPGTGNTGGGGSTVF